MLLGIQAQKLLESHVRIEFLWISIDAFYILQHVGCLLCHLNNKKIINWERERERERERDP